MIELVDKMLRKHMMELLDILNGKSAPSQPSSRLSSIVIWPFVMKELIDKTSPYGITPPPPTSPNLTKLQHEVSAGRYVFKQPLVITACGVQDMCFTQRVRNVLKDSAMASAQCTDCNVNACTDSFCVSS